jgi:hypothetical protein
MGARAHLPNRQPSLTVDLELARIRYAATIGFDCQVRPGEIFCLARRSDSDADVVADDVSVLLSLLLRHGVLPADIGRSIGRLHDRPASIAGTLVDILAEHGGSE